MTRRITILDSTLRDGAQGEEISFSVNDKLNIVAALDGFGIDFIEAGNPGSNPKDLEFFARVGKLKLGSARICAFGSTRRRGVAAVDDANLRSLLDADTTVVVVFGKSSLMHATEVLRVTPEENLQMITDTVAHLKGQDKMVIFDAEHFFDGYAEDSTYALAALAAAAQAGADILCLCDTNGGTLPRQIFDATKAVVEAFSASAPIGIHAHNDAGCAVANSLMALEAGATHVQGTFVGIGERCGNADLSSILPAIRLKMGFECQGELPFLTETAGTIAEIANVMLPNDRPYVGTSAFSHKAGMHVDGVLKKSASFEHVDPQSVGNKRRFLVSEVSGRGGIWERVRTIAPELTRDSPELNVILKRLKELEHQGYVFEAADASFALMVRRAVGTYVPHFSVVFYKTMGEFPTGDDHLSSTATIQIEVDGSTEITAAKGHGPVHALDSALRKALMVFYPSLADMHLIDYKVRVLEQQAATAAKVRVLIESADQYESWTTVGVSDDIIEASFMALIDSIEYRLARGINVE